MKTTSTAVRRLLREGNPVPGDAFPDAAHHRDGQAALAAILAAPSRTPAHFRLPTARRLSTWKFAIAPTAVAAVLVAIAAVAMSTSTAPQQGSTSRSGTTSQPPAGLATLVADLTARPSAQSADAVTVLRQLAAAAATQPAVPLGPVEYSDMKSWGLDGSLHYNLDYVSHETQTSQQWMASDGSSLWYFIVPGGRYEPGTIPIQRNGPSPAGKARFAWYDPAKLPVSITALRDHLIDGPDTRGIHGSGSSISCTVTGSLGISSSGSSGGISSSGSSGGTSVSSSGSSSASATGSSGGTPAPGSGKPSCHRISVPVSDRDTDAIVYNTEDLMNEEPLPPAVRASLLQVLADSAAQGLSNAHFIDMGTATDRTGQAGVAIGYQAPDTSGPLGDQSHLEVLVFSPRTGALLGDEDAYCRQPADISPAAGDCAPEAYDQVLQVKAVPSIPPTRRSHQSHPGRHRVPRRPPPGKASTR